MKKILQESQLIESSFLNRMQNLAGKSPVTLKTFTLSASTEMGGTTFS